MNRDHAIRIAVSHLKGEMRSREILRLLQDRERLTQALQIKFRLFRIRRIHNAKLKST